VVLEVRRIEAMKKLVETARHWWAFQQTAKNLGCWCPRFLAHDIGKMVMIAILGDEKATKIHRQVARHHEQNGKIRDILAAVIDWECARITKPEKPLNARQTWVKFYSHVSGVENCLKKLGL
jgi:hypothetical protein